MSTAIEITSMSTKGQIVIPTAIRKSLNLGSGAKFMIVVEGDCILLKPIVRPAEDTFERIMALGDRVQRELGLKDSDVKSAIHATRKNARRN